MSQLAKSIEAEDQPILRRKSRSFVLLTLARPRLHDNRFGDFGVFQETDCCMPKTMKTDLNLFPSGPHTSSGPLVRSFF